MLISVGSQWLRDNGFWDKYIEYLNQFNIKPPILADFRNFSISMATSTAYELGILAAILKEEEEEEEEQKAT